MNSRFRPIPTLLLFLIMAVFASMVYAVTFGQWTQTTFTGSDGTYSNTEPRNGNADVGTISISSSLTYTTSGPLTDLISLQLDVDSNREYVVGNTAGQVIAFQDNHSVMWSRTGLGYVLSLASADVNNDGIDDVIVGTTGASTLYVLNGTDGTTLTGFPIGNPILFSNTVPGDGSTFNATAKDFNIVRGAQLDGDANREIVGATTFGTVGAFQNNGSTMWLYTPMTDTDPTTYNGATNGARRRVLALITGDLNADNIDDVIYLDMIANGPTGTIYALNGSTGALLAGWPVTSTNFNYLDVKLNNLALVASGGATKNRIAVGCSDGYVRFYDFSGGLQATSPLLDSGSPVYCVEARNTDGSAGEETPAGTKSGRLYCLDTAGTSSLWDYTPGSFIFKSLGQCTRTDEFPVAARNSQYVFLNSGSVQTSTATASVGYSSAVITDSLGRTALVYTGWDNIVRVLAYRSNIASVSGYYISNAISPTGGVLRWRTITYTTSTPVSTTLTVDILRGSDNSLLISNIVSGTDISSYLPTYTGSIRLRANLATTDPAATPLLRDWTVGYEANDVNTYTSARTGPWDDPASWTPAGIPGANDTATIVSPNQISISGTNYIRNLTINSGGYLVFSRTASASPTLIATSGGAITNSGTVSATNTTNAYPVVISSTGVATWTGNALIVNAASPYNLQYYELGNFAYAPQLFTYQNRLTIRGNVYANYATSPCITINDFNEASLTVASGALLRCRESIANNGFLILSANSDLVMDPQSTLIYIFNYGNGVITATGTSSASRDCRISRSSTAAAAGRYSLQMYDLSDTLLRYCDISGMEQVAAQYVNGAASGARTGTAPVGEGLTIDSCNIRDSYTNQTTSTGLNIVSAVNANGTGVTVLNSNIYNINGGSTTNYGIYVWGSSGFGNTHTISGTAVYNVTTGTTALGVYWYYNIVAGYVSTFTNNRIYNCTTGMQFFLAQNTGLFTMSNCSFGVGGINPTADVFLWDGTTNTVQMQNCLLNSPNEVVVSATSTAYLPSYVRSLRHDQTPGLTRIWGDYRAIASESYRYDQELYAGAGDQNIQKVIEFGPTAVPALAYASTVNTMLAGSRYAIGFEASGLTLTITGTSSAPTLVRSVTGSTNPYGFYVFKNIAVAPAVVMNYVEFQNLNAQGLCLGGLPDTLAVDNNRRDVLLSTFQNIFFRNNASTGRHLTVREGATRTSPFFSGCSFDASTAYDITAGQDLSSNLTNITLTNWQRQRATPNDQVQASSVVTWQAPSGTNYVSNGTGLWSDTTIWSPVGLPGQYDRVTITGTDVVDVWSTRQCQSISITSGANLRFLPGAGSTNAILQIASGGVISNSGNITLGDSDSVLYAGIEPITPTSSTAIVFVGNNILWDQDNLSTPRSVPWRFRGVEFRSPITINQPAGITFAGNMWTQGVNIQRGCTLTFDPITTAAGAPARFTWIATGNINVGNTGSGSDGILLIIGAAGEGADLKINCASNGQYGLNIYSTGAITATGAATGNRNATISSMSGFRGYIYAQPQSYSRFQYCELYNLGDSGAEIRNGLVISGVNNSVAGESFTVDSSDVHDNYTGIYGRSVSNTSITTCNVYNNSNAGIYVTGAADGNSYNIAINTNSIYSNGTYGVYIDNYVGGHTLSANNIYNNSGIGLHIAGGTVTGGSIYGNNYGARVMWGPVFTNVSFGTPTPNTTSDVIFNNTTVNVGGAVFQNCLFSSSTEVAWSNNNPPAGCYIISQRHDQTNGQIRIWGDYYTATGTVNWNTTQPSYSGGADSNVAKTIRFMAGPSALNSGRSRFRLDTGATIDMASGNGAITQTTLVADNTSYPIDLVISGTISASYYTLNNLNTNGLYLTGASGNINTLDYGTFQTSAGGSNSYHIRFDNSGFGASRTVANCSFDNSTSYDVSVNIGANVITMSNYINDTPLGGDKDYKVGSSNVVWQQTGVFISQASGNWADLATWGTAATPTISDSVVISGPHTVTISGTGYANDIQVNGALVMDGSSGPVDLQIQSNGVLTNSGTVTVTNAANSITIRSAGTSYVRVVGTDFRWDANCNLYLVNYQPATMTIPATVSGVTVTFTGPVRTRGVQINSGGEIRNQTNNVEWMAEGNIIVNGVLRLGNNNNTWTRINCPAADEQYGIRVNANGKIFAYGASSGNRSCFINRAGTYRTYMLLSQCEAVFQYCAIADMGQSGPIWGFRFENIDGSQADRGMTVRGCNVYDSNVALYVVSCTNNTTANGNRGIYDNNLYNSQQVLFASNSISNTISNNAVYAMTFAGLRLDAMNNFILPAGAINITSGAGLVLASGSSNNNLTFSQYNVTANGGGGLRSKYIYIFYIA